MTMSQFDMSNPSNQVEGSWVVWDLPDTRVDAPQLQQERC
ncbi:hypothetical protein SAMN04488548_1101, partial [Gordonia westfalica]